MHCPNKCKTRLSTSYKKYKLTGEFKRQTWTEPISKALAINQMIAERNSRNKTVEVLCSRDNDSRAALEYITAYMYVYKHFYESCDKKNRLQLLLLRPRVPMTTAMTMSMTSGKAKLCAQPMPQNTSGSYDRSPAKNKGIRLPG